MYLARPCALRDVAKPSGDYQGLRNVRSIVGRSFHDTPVLISTMLETVSRGLVGCRSSVVDSPMCATTTMGSWDAEPLTTSSSTAAFRSSGSSPYLQANIGSTTVRPSKSSLVGIDSWHNWIRLMSRCVLGRSTGDSGDAWTNQSLHPQTPDCSWPRAGVNRTSARLRRVD